MNPVRAFCCAILIVVTMARGAQPQVGANDLPRMPPTEAADAIKSFEVHKGLRIELVASEPLISSPVGICFDEDGRLFVVEMRDYPDLADQRLGRIKLLTDSRGGNGHYDRATVFVDHIPWPTGCMWSDGGLLVTASPDIIYLKDTQGRGVADRRSVLFTGFGVTTDPLNVQGLVNGLTWTLENRIQGTTSEDGGLVSRPGPSERPLDLRHREFSFDPRRLDLRPESGVGQHGLSFDSWGREFVCNNSDPIQTYMYEARYGVRNPLFAMPPALAEIHAGGPDVFRISPEEPWRVLRTRWRVSGLASGPIENGGRSGGYFTGVSGITIYTGDALPPAFRDNAFIGEVANNLVHREVISGGDDNRLEMSAGRAADEPRSEFVASKDTWFRPVQLANGPDGALYIVDMYREVIEHPWSLPDSIKSRLDLHSGTDRGRIWRVVPDGFVAHRKPPKLSRTTTAELVSLLAHPNGWHRMTAARLLFERQDRAALPMLAKLLNESRSPLARLHALCAIDGLGDVGPDDLLTALKDMDGHVRQRAVRLSEKLLRLDQCPPAVWARLAEMADDPSILVRYQLAFTLGEAHERPRRVAALGRIAHRDLSDRWMAAAILSSIAGDEAAMFGIAADDERIRNSAAGQEFLERLASMIGSRNVASEIKQVLELVDARAKQPDPRLAFSLARALREGLRDRSAAGPMDELLSRARAVTADEAAPQQTRVAAVQLLGTTSYSAAGTVLLPLLDGARAAEPLQLAAIDALDHFADPNVGPELVRRIDAFLPRPRSAALAVLLKRPDRALALLHGIDSKRVLAGDLHATQASFLRKHADPRVRALARQLLPVDANSRDKVIKAFEPALELSGDARHGHEIYLQRCSSCHRLGGEGFAVGPDLTTVRNAGKQKLLVNVLDPNREVAPNYVAYLVETRHDESLVGIIAAESAGSVTVRQAFGRETVVPRGDIRRIESQRLSLMPEGLEQGLTPQDAADLLEFVFTVGTHP